MYDQLKKVFTQTVSLTDAEFERFTSLLVVQKLKRKELLLQEGSVARNVAFINKGILRYFYNVDGEEHTGQFFFENAWYTDYESFLTEQPTHQNIEALEACELLVLSKKELYRLYAENPKFERFGRFMAERAYLGLRKRNEALINLSPEDRYLNLIAERPKVIQRIPQHYVASFLGIQPQSLSRIRKRLADGH